MSAYGLQKLIREVNRSPAARQAFMNDATGFAAEFDLTDHERGAVVARDWTALYQLGVHGLLLRPFSILHGVSEPDYLLAIRKHAA
jgi:hypothetical protein